MHVHAADVMRVIGLWGAGGGGGGQETSNYGNQGMLHSLSARHNVPMCSRDERNP